MVRGVSCLSCHHVCRVSFSLCISGVLIPFTDVFESLGDLTTVNGAFEVKTDRNRVLFTTFVIAAIQGGGTCIYYYIAECVCHSQLYRCVVNVC